MKRLLMLTLIVMAGTGVIASKEKNDRGLFGLQKSADLQFPWAKHAQQGFSIKLWISTQIAMGIEAWSPTNVPIEDCSTGIGCEYPAGTASCIEHLFGAAPIIGGKINGVRHVSEGYNSEDARHEFFPAKGDTLRDRIWRTIATDPNFDYNFDPPRLLTQPANRRDCDDDGDGKVDEDDLDGLDNDGDWVRLTDDVGSDGIPDPLEVGCDGKAYDPVTNPDPAGDNYEPSKRDKCRPDPNTGNLPLKNSKDRYTEKNGLPDHGEPHVDEDYAAVSDNDLYLSATDTVFANAPSGHVPMGLKIIMKSYAWRGTFAEGIIPIEYYIVNVGHNVITDVYVGFVADFDVGPVNVANYPAHNYSCYMADLYTAYVHNAQDRGSTPLGLTVLGAPLPLDQLQYIFQWYNIGDYGTNDSVHYSWLNGEEFAGQKIKACQSPELPADTRLFYSFGKTLGSTSPSKFDTLKPGDTLKITMAVVGGEGVESGVHSLRENAQSALKLYRRGFKVTATLPSPKLEAIEGFKKVTLKWHPDIASNGGPGPATIWDDSNRIAGNFPPDHWRRVNPPCDPPGSSSCSQGHACTSSGYLPGGRVHEGFRLYRTEDPNNTTPNDKNWTLLKEYDYADDEFNFNVGIDSVFVDTNLVRGKRYWYSVTSFGIPDLALIPRPDSGGTIAYDSLIIPGIESSLGSNATRVDLTFSPSQNVSEVLAVPNPYRVDQDYTFESGGWEGRSSNWDERKRLIKFIHLPKKCKIRIFSLAGDQIAELDHDDPVVGEIEWNLVSESNRALASGVYVFTVDALDDGGGKIGSQIGKFVLIR
ncbi:MAG TPA: hypothetical protein VL633_04495 [Bacteroidota bacterium]|nr:hypothetical protein [Bacteroidota bacterium]